MIDGNDHRRFYIQITACSRIVFTNSEWVRPVYPPSRSTWFRVAANLTGASHRFEDFSAALMTEIELGQAAKIVLLTPVFDSSLTDSFAE